MNQFFRGAARQIFRAAFIVFTGCVCLAPFPLAAQTPAGGALSAVLVSERDRLFLSALFRLSSPHVILEPIASGLKSRAEFTIQLVEPRAGLFSFLGDAVLLEKTVSCLGYADFFEKVFVLEDEEGQKTIYPRESDFAAAFASLSRHPLDDFVKARGNEGSFLRVRAKVYPVQLVSPLTLIYLLSSSGIIESDWVKIEFPLTLR